MLKTAVVGAVFYLFKFFNFNDIIFGLVSAPL